MSESFSTPWTVACQAPLSMGFPRQEYWSRLPFPTWCSQIKKMNTKKKKKCPFLHIYANELGGKSRGLSKNSLIMHCIWFEI